MNFPKILAIACCSYNAQLCLNRSQEKKNVGQPAPESHAWAAHHYINHKRLIIENKIQVSPEIL
jgi:hypothetical protein